MLRCLLRSVRGNGIGLAGYKQPMQTEIAASVAPLACVADYNGLALVVVVSVVGLSGLR